MSTTPAPVPILPAGYSVYPPDSVSGIQVFCQEIFAGIDGKHRTQIVFEVGPPLKFRSDLSYYDHPPFVPNPPADPHANDPSLGQAYEWSNPPVEGVKPSIPEVGETGHK